MSLFLALIAPVSSAEPPVVQQLGGDWSARAQAGWPWSGVSGELGLTDRVAAQAAVTSAVARRWDAQAGAAFALVRAPRLQLSAGLYGGAVYQPPAEPGVRQLAGPQVEFGLRAVVPTRVAPWLALSSQHLLQIERTVLTTSGGEQVSTDICHLWTPAGSLGVWVPLAERFGLEAGMDVMAVDGSFSIPGFHLAARIGGGQ